MSTIIDQYHNVNSKDQWHEKDEEMHNIFINYAYQVKKFEKKIRPDSVSDIYRIFIDNWSESVMEWVMGYKILLFDKQEKTIADIYFEPVSELKMDHIRRLFEIISKIPDANSIIIGRNHPSRDIKPDIKERAFATIFNKCAKKNRVTIKDQYVVSMLGMYKFKKDDYMLEKDLKDTFLSNWEL